MGGNASRLSLQFSQKEMRILMIGLDGAGKTTIFNKLRIGQIEPTTPTIGFNVRTIDYRKASFIVGDVGGQDEFRPLWKPYFQNTRAIIFVVDSSDRARIPQAREELQWFLSQDELRDAHLLVFANKQDLPNAMDDAEITDRLGLGDRDKRNYYVHPTCAPSGDGVFEGLEWLTMRVNKT